MHHSTEIEILINLNCLIRLKKGFLKFIKTVLEYLETLTNKPNFKLGCATFCIKWGFANESIKEPLTLPCKRCHG